MPSFDRTKNKTPSLTVVGIISFLPAFVWSPVEYERRHEQVSENLAHARQEAREFGVQRREEIRERVREFRRLGEESRVPFETDKVEECDDEWLSITLPNHLAFPQKIARACSIPKYTHYLSPTKPN